ncbi:MAG: 5,10-methylenetetrahydromethanopterin reductase [Alphaproteobacteria bacterium]|nr:5,10-methylenetetrahydromethanopterin reductase [Alphaproteobacteria bacterium]
MQVGFFFWPYNLDLCEKLAERADRYGYAMIGIADTPGNAMDPWVSAAMVARASQHTRVALCVTNLLTRHPAVSAAAIASLDHVSNGRAVLGIGAGHSGTKNVGLPKSRAKDLAEGVTFIKTLLKGEPATLGTASAHLPWIKRAPPVFLAASHPKPLQAAGQTADGVIANYGLAAENIKDSEGHIFAGAKDAGRSPDEIEIWQIGALDCSEDRDAARAKVGAMLAFLAGYVIGDKHLDTRGVPEPLREPLLELRGRYSTRPGEADIKLVQELGLFDYLSRRLSICGNPQDCLAQGLAAKAAGAKRLMLTVSLASDPVRTVELFGEHVLPKL